MNIEVRYYSKTGNSKKLAMAIGEELEKEALDITNNLDKDVDILFICNAIYWAGIDFNVKKYINENASKIRLLVNISTAGIKKSSYKKMKKLAKKNNIKISDKEFHVPGRFMGMHKNRPNDDDLLALREFVKGVIEDGRD
ncbi:MAG: flavodoxin [bacterium]|nr:flavodoxin [bacterium]